MSKRTVNHDNPGGTNKKPAKAISNNDTPTRGSIVKREGAGGHSHNSFTGSRKVAAQKSYSTTTLRDGTGAKGAKGK